MTPSCHLRLVHQKAPHMNTKSFKKLYQSLYFSYTLSHPENDRDVTERVQGYTVQEASFMHQSRSF